MNIVHSSLVRSVSDDWRGTRTATDEPKGVEEDAETNALTELWSPFDGNQDDDEGFARPLVDSITDEGRSQFPQFGGV